MSSLRLVACGVPLLLGSALRAQSTIFDLAGVGVDRYGHVCAPVGDTNGDGFGEVLVTASSNDPGGVLDAGRVILYSGATGAVLTTIIGNGINDRLGYAGSAVGDVNGDGSADVCVTSLRTTGPGQAHVLSGLDGSVLHTLSGPVNGLFGWATAGVGDVNGDGRDDVLVSAPSGRDPSGHVTGSLTVFSGADGSVLQRVFGDLLSSLSNGLGTSVGRVGDVDGDGKADFAGVQASAVRLFSGADGSELWRRSTGTSEGRISGAIDANGDGFDDFVIGARTVNAEAGRAQLVSGRDNSLLFEVFGTTAGDWLGASVTGAGDLDGDGYGDFAAGLPGFDGAAGADTGAVRAFSGRTGGVLFTVEGDLAGDQLGWSLDGGRDVNGDGIPDVLVGSVASGKVKAVSFVPRGLEPFGTGTAGCAGASTLLANGVPKFGSPGFLLHASNTGAAPHLLISDSEDTAGSLHLGPRFGARFHLDFNPPPPAVGLVFHRPLPAPDAIGSLVFPFPIPSTPALAGLSLVFQVASLSPAGTCAQRLGTSRGLRVTIQ